MSLNLKVHYPGVIRGFRLLLPAVDRGQFMFLFMVCNFPLFRIVSHELFGYRVNNRKKLLLVEISNTAYIFSRHVRAIMLTFGSNLQFSLG